MSSKAAFRLFTLVVLCTLCRAQSLSIISQAPTPVLTSSSSRFTPNGPSSSFDSLGTGSTTTPTTTIFGITEPTFPPTMTSCFIPPTGSISSTEVLDPSASTQPAGAECVAIIHQSDHVIEMDLFTVAQDGSTILPAYKTSVPSSSSKSIGTGSIVGAVIGSIFGTLLIGATFFWIRKQRRSSKPAGNWLNRPAGWVRDEKEPANVIEMSRRDGV